MDQWINNPLLKKYGSGETGADSDGRLSDEREIRKGSGADHAGSDHECQETAFNSLPMKST